jgi:hypothetical protein
MTRASCPGCIILPQVSILQGYYAVTPSATAALTLDLGEGTKTIPARSFAVPYIALDGKLYEPADVGLPLLREAMTPWSDATVPPGPQGASTAYGYQHSLFSPRATEDLDLSYRLQTFPSGTLEGRLPPKTGETLISVDATVRTINRSNFELSDRTLDKLDKRVLTLRSNYLGLTGFRVSLEDTRFSVRVSPEVTLERGAVGEEVQVTLPTIEQETMSGALRSSVAVVVAPPRGSFGIPSVRFQYPTGAFDLTAVYQDLPGPVPVAGFVHTELGAVRSQVTFESEELAVRGAQSFARTAIRYSTTVDTDGLGRFLTVLPPGAYSVSVRPAAVASVLRSAAAAVRLSGDSRIVIAPTASANLDFLLKERPRISGVVLWDGRPVVGARLSMRTEVSGVLRPTLVEESTDTSGAFALSVDPGPLTLTVAPPLGSKLPWISRKLTVNNVSSIVLQPLTLPIPARKSLRLRAPGAAPLSRATVRAFRREGTRFVEVGTAMTDGNGDVDLYLEPTQSQ